MQSADRDHALRIFKTTWVARFARRERVSNASLREAIERAERGLIDADLSGGLIGADFLAADEPEFERMIAQQDLQEIVA